MSRSPEFINYVKTPLAPQVIQTVFNSKGVTYEKTKLFGDLINTFMLRTVNTYLGAIESNIFTKTQQRNNHFRWCWNQTILDFNKEGIIFYDDNKVREYFKEVTTKSFYTFTDKSKSGAPVLHALNLWYKLFTYDGIKSQMDVDGFLDIYGLFDEALKGKSGKRLDL